MTFEFSEKYKSMALLVFRIFFGILFFMHGISKFAKGTPSGMFLAAGIIEIVVGVAVLLGIFTMYASALGSLEMLAAFFIAHVPKGLNPMANGGELALLFFAAFLMLTFVGPGKYALDSMISKKKQ